MPFQGSIAGEGGGGSASPTTTQVWKGQGGHSFCMILRLLTFLERLSWKMSTMITGLSLPWRAAHTAGARRSPPLFDEKTSSEGRIPQKQLRWTVSPLSKQPLLNCNVEPQWSTAGERETGHYGRLRPNSTSFLKLLHMLIKAAFAICLTRFRPCQH